MKTTPAKRAVFKPPVLHGFHAAANSLQRNDFHEWCVREYRLINV